MFHNYLNLIRAIAFLELHFLFQLIKRNYVIQVYFTLLAEYKIRLAFIRNKYIVLEQLLFLKHN